ncbi:MAG TPA: amidase, partial [Gemmataceae bacterium]|nr:amidase [Gemmataceae bacterium]
MLIERPASELLGLLSGGEITAEALTAEYLAAIHARDSQVRAFLHVDEDGALGQARAVDARRKRGEPVGALAGLPVALKDVFCTRGQPTTCGSKILQHFRPPYDAHVVERLRRADAVLLGKTNMDEFA